MQREKRWLVFIMVAMCLGFWLVGPAEAGEEKRGSAGTKTEKPQPVQGGFFPVAGVVKAISENLGVLENSGVAFAGASALTFAKGMKDCREGLRELAAVNSLPPQEQKKAALSASLKLAAGATDIMKETLSAACRAILELSRNRNNPVAKATLERCRKMFGSTIELFKQMKGLMAGLEAAGKSAKVLEGIVAVIDGLGTAGELIKNPDGDMLKCYAGMTDCTIKIGAGISKIADGLGVKGAAIPEAMFEFAQWVNDNKGFSDTRVMKKIFSEEYRKQDLEGKQKALDDFTPSIIGMIKNSKKPENLALLKEPLQEGFLLAHKAYYSGDSFWVEPYKTIMSEFREVITANRKISKDRKWWAAAVREWIKHRQYGQLFQIAFPNDEFMDLIKF